MTSSLVRVEGGAGSVQDDQGAVTMVQCKLVEGRGVHGDPLKGLSAGACSVAPFSRTTRAAEYAYRSREVQLSNNSPTVGSTWSLRSCGPTCLCRTATRQRDASTSRRLRPSTSLYAIHRHPGAELGPHRQHARGQGRGVDDPTAPRWRRDGAPLQAMSDAGFRQRRSWIWS